MELAIFVFSGIAAGATVWLAVLYRSQVRETHKLNALLAQSERNGSDRG